MKKTVAIFSAKKAKRDYNDKFLKFQELQGRMKQYDSNGNQINKSTGMVDQVLPAMPGLDTHMVSQGIPTTFASKQAMARNMGMNDYYGASHQDERLMMGMQAKGQNDQMKQQGDSENKRADQEFGLKEKELALKEKQSEPTKPVETKMPTADDIASSLLKAYKNQ